MPVPRNHLGGVALDGRIYAVGGQSGQDQSAVYRANVDAYDPATNTWTAVAPLPVAMSHNNASTFTMGGRIIETGGETAFGQPINNVRAYDPAKDQWVELTPLPANKSAAVACGINGVIYNATGNTTRVVYKGVPVP